MEDKQAQPSNIKSGERDPAEAQRIKQEIARQQQAAADRKKEK